MSQTDEELRRLINGAMLHRDPVDKLFRIIKARDAAKEQAIEALKRIVIHAAPDGTQDDGDFVGFYVLPTGPIHSGIAALQAVGKSSDTMGDVSVISRYQAHLAARDAAKEREILGLPQDGKWYDISLQAKAGERVLIANYQRRESDKEEL